MEGRRSAGAGFETTQADVPGNRRSRPSTAETLYAVLDSIACLERAGPRVSIGVTISAVNGR